MYKIVKRGLDIVFSFIFLIVLLPIMVIISILIKIDSRGPVLFKQKRIGKNKKLFIILKFRTMYAMTPTNIPTHLLNNPNIYITRIGKILRKTSLDELPQLWNVLIGDMSIIGPRPALWNQYDLIKERDKYYANNIRPGLTGWAQINGRDELLITVKARFDGEYIEKMSFRFDFKCFIGTIYYVIKHNGIVEGNTEVMKSSMEIAATEETPSREDFT